MLAHRLRHRVKINPLTAGVAYIRGFHLLLAHQLPPVKDKNQQYLKTVDLHFVKSE